MVFWGELSKLRISQNSGTLSTLGICNQIYGSCLGPANPEREISTTERLKKEDSSFQGLQRCIRFRVSELSPGWDNHRGLGDIWG